MEWDLYDNLWSSKHKIMEGDCTGRTAHQTPLFTHRNIWIGDMLQKIYCFKL